MGLTRARNYNVFEGVRQSEFTTPTRGCVNQVGFAFNDNRSRVDHHEDIVFVHWFGVWHDPKLTPAVGLAIRKRFPAEYLCLVLQITRPRCQIAITLRFWNQELKHRWQHVSIQAA